MRRELADGEIFDNPPFDFFEAVMILIQNAARLGDIDRRFLGQTPGQLDQPIEIAPRHSVFRRRFGHSLQPAQFLAGLLLDLLRHMRLGDRVAELAYLLGLACFALAELALDRRHLLAQQNLALTLVQCGLGLPSDFLRYSQDLDMMRKYARRLLCPGGDVNCFENFLPLVGLEIQVGGSKIRQPSRRSHRLDRRLQFFGRVRQ